VFIILKHMFIMTYQHCELVWQCLKLERICKLLDSSFQNSDLLSLDFKQLQRYKKQLHSLSNGLFVKASSNLSTARQMMSDMKRTTYSFHDPDMT